MTRSDIELAVLELSVEEQLSLIEHVWDRLAADPLHLPPLSEDDLAVLEERLAAHEADPTSVLSPDEVVLEARRRMHRR